MKVTQGQFSFLPDLTDSEIKMQVQYGLDQGWALAIEYTDDPHPRNSYWEMWGIPMFDLKDAAGVMMELSSCRAEHSDSYIKLGERTHVLYGQSPEIRARLRTGAAGSGGPQHSLYAAQPCHAPGA
jgi:hypothetical protein